MKPIRFLGCAVPLHLAVMALAGTGTAVAATAPATTPCEGAISQPFAQWNDDRWYALAPGGDFEASSTDWTLTRGATRVAGGSPFGQVGASSLQLPAGAQAVSAPVCVDPSRPTFRFFLRNNGGGSKSSQLKVEVLFPRTNSTAPGVTTAASMTVAQGAWRPSGAMTNSTDQALKSGGGTPTIQYRFTAASGSWQIDDLFVDPRMR